MMEFGTIRLIYAEDSTKGSLHFTEMRVELTQLTIVRNQQGKWLTDLSPEAERKMRENKKIAYEFLPSRRRKKKLSKNNDFTGPPQDAP